MRGKQVYPIRRVWSVIILYLPIPIYTDGGALMLLLLVHTQMIHFFQLEKVVFVCVSAP